MLPRAAISAVSPSILGLGTRAVLAVLLAWAFVCVTLSTHLHRHAAPVLQAQAMTAGGGADRAIPTTAPSPEENLSPRDCSWCDFAVVPVTTPPAVLPPVLAPIFTSAGTASCSRSAPSLLDCFCDHPTARAPPLA
ncbi:MAG: hypothetical protein H7Z41_11445 [Cytophagales bacterium]|nr:hypothetical protein [Armatimonadota bacterium]